MKKKIVNDGSETEPSLTGNYSAYMRAPIHSQEMNILLYKLLHTFVVVCLEEVQ